tara:strand:+ start:7443 stop:9869 length:2427 start_codon:yes stop_codon:yes gene_type:complete
LENGYSYGVTITTDDGLICIGGEWGTDNNNNDQKKISNKTFIIRYLGNGEVDIDYNSLPPTPEPIYAMGGAKIGTDVYIVGGKNNTKETKSFWKLNLLLKDKWQILEPWEGSPRSHLVVESQSDGINECLYIFSGRFYDPKRGWQFLTDGFKYNPKIGNWEIIADVGTSLTDSTSICVMAAPSINLGANHIAVFSGVSGEIFNKSEQNIPNKRYNLEKKSNLNNAGELGLKKWSMVGSQPGFSKDVLIYHTITNTWNKFGKIPDSIRGKVVGSHVTTNAVKWGNDIIIASGEVRPGVSSPKVWSITPKITNQFGIVNYIFLFTYFIILIIIGFYFLNKNTNIDNYFKAGGRIPWWAAGISIFITQLSAITVMAIPARSFSSNWTWISLSMTIVIVAPLVSIFILPFYRRLNITTAYEYLEKRFDVIVRMIASALFMIFQFARGGIVLYLPAIALSIVTNIDIRICILSVGLFSIFYTLLGGIEAVIWTDVFQVFVLLIGALVTLIIIPHYVDGGVSGMLQIALEDEKLKLFDFRFSLKEPTFWILFLGGFGNNIISYGSDQTVIQRYLTTKNEKDASRAIWTNAFMVIPTIVIWFTLGTAIYTFYKSNPSLLSATMERTDGIFPWFIATELPVGISGLLIAGIFSASMSSLDSSMNSVATAFTTDFYKRIKISSSNTEYLSVARVSTVIFGLLSIIFALSMATWEIQSIWSVFVKYIGLFGGGLGGVFILAIFTNRVDSKCAIFGLITSTIIQYILLKNDSINGVLFSAIGIISCILAGYLLSFIMFNNQKNLSGLTIHSIKGRKLNN